MWPNPQETADLVTFTEENLNEKLYFCAVYVNVNFDLIISSKYLPVQSQQYQQ